MILACLPLAVRERSHFNFLAEADILFLIIGNALYIAVLTAVLLTFTIALSEILDEKMQVVDYEKSLE